VKPGAAALLLICGGLGCGKSTPSSVDGGTNHDTDTPSDSESDQPYDCEGLSAGPFDSADSVEAPAVDIAFDAEGNLVGCNGSGIFKTPLGGDPELFVPGVTAREGMRYLPDGHLVFNDSTSGTMVRVDPDGDQHVAAQGLNYPDGLTVDPEGMVYVTEQNAGRVRRIAPYTGDSTILVDGLTSPVGITFDPGYDLLYIGTWNGDDNVIRTLEIDADGNPGELEDWVTDVGSGWHDGMGVDACGNVYVADYECLGEWDDTCVYRISPDGEVEPEPVIHPAENLYLPNIEWGSGIGGWDASSIFMADGWDDTVYRFDIGVPSKPKVFP
jgi:hypothetical protein